MDPPTMGEHTRELLTAIGYLPEEIDDLIAQGAVA
jgi:crotonobetainyl-CoA:carnitine CoA-transferase CaiB-like acyl-CoA transferase